MNRAPNEASFLIVGTCRNVEGTIESDLARIRSAIPSENVSFLVVESDSSDGTVSTLLKLKQKVKNFRYFTEGALIHRMNERVERISFCRNKYLKDIKENPLYRDIDYVVVADLDGLNLLVDKERIKSCWSRTGWDVCTANQLDCYYDIYALRHPDWSPSDFQMHWDFLKKFPNPKFKTDYNYLLFSKMITIPQEAQWIEVDSSFGGLAVYKKSFFVLGAYNHLDEQGRICCEHVAFHREIKRHGARIYINPALINAKNTEHGYSMYTGKIMKIMKRLHKSFSKRLRRIF